MSLPAPTSKASFSTTDLEASRSLADTATRPWDVVAIAFNLLDPLPFGFFAAALCFDAVYANTGEIMWVKSAAWLIASGLLFAIVPRLINLVQVWFPRQRAIASGQKTAFWLNLVAVVAAIVNAFVHSRDAYGTMPDGLWLSMLTVFLLVVSNVVLTKHRSDAKVRT